MKFSGSSSLVLDSDRIVGVEIENLNIDSIEQAVERSGTKAGNKGAEAAMSALEMVSLMGKLS